MWAIYDKRNQMVGTPYLSRETAEYEMSLLSGWHTVMTA